MVYNIGVANVCCTWLFVWQWSALPGFETRESLKLMNIVTKKIVNVLCIRSTCHEKLWGKKLSYVSQTVLCVDTLCYWLHPCPTTIMWYMPSNFDKPLQNKIFGLFVVGLDSTKPQAFTLPYKRNWTNIGVILKPSISSQTWKRDQKWSLRHLGVTWIYTNML